METPAFIQTLRDECDRIDSQLQTLTERRRRLSELAAHYGDYDLTDQPEASSPAPAADKQNDREASGTGRGRGSRFSDDDYAKWAKMRAAGMTITAIAAEVGASHPTVANGIKSLLHPAVSDKPTILMRTTAWPSKSKPDGKGRQVKPPADPADSGNQPTLAELVNYLRLKGRNTSLWAANGPPHLDGQATTFAVLLELANEHRAAADLPPYEAA